MQNNTTFHGSDVEVVEKKYGINKEEIINFSSNVNPMGMPKSVRAELIENIDILEHYPDRENSLLKSSLSKYTSVDENLIAIGNGASEVTKSFINAIAPKKSLILAPTYSEYESELLAFGSKVEYFVLNEEKDFRIDLDELSVQLKNGYDLFIICNPNNPTSTFIDSNTLKEVTKICKQYNTYVMVDETYIEFVEGFFEGKVNSTSLISDENLSNLIILRGVSKFYSLAGLRFGYGMTNNKKLLEIVGESMNTWSVNSLVEVATVAFTSDKFFMDLSAKFIATERNKVVDRLLKLKSLKVFEPKANFVLVKILNEKTSTELFEKAISEKFMIRDCKSFNYLSNKFFRFCFLESENNDKLLDFLEKEFN